MSNAKVVLTDSEGIQEETTILQISCLTLRDNTERPITTKSKRLHFQNKFAKLFLPTGKNA
jgi:UDP-N-acetylglucosamine 2-epimerase (non-hydrolysing)